MTSGLTFFFTQARYFSVTKANFASLKKTAHHSSYLYNVLTESAYRCERGEVQLFDDQLCSVCASLLSDLPSRLLSPARVPAGHYHAAPELHDAGCCGFPYPAVSTGHYHGLPIHRFCFTNHLMSCCLQSSKLQLRANVSFVTVQHRNTSLPTIHNG